LIKTKEVITIRKSKKSRHTIAKGRKSKKGKTTIYKPFGSRLRNPLQKLEKLPARPRKRNTSLLPSGNETLNASTSGGRKGMKPLGTIQHTLKHRKTIVSPT
jgi:hypothetical protein